jgi:hypothetical protein
MSTEFDARLLTPSQLDAMDNLSKAARGGLQVGGDSRMFLDDEHRAAIYRSGKRVCCLTEDARDALLTLRPALAAEIIRTIGYAHQIGAVDGKEAAIRMLEERA